MIKRVYVFCIATIHGNVTTLPAYYRTAQISFSDQMLTKIYVLLNLVQ